MDHSSKDRQVDHQHVHGQKVKTPRTIWHLYNDKAGTIDRELQQEWSDSLNFLLIFVSKFYNFILGHRVIIILLGGAAFRHCNFIHYRKHETSPRRPTGQASLHNSFGNQPKHYPRLDPVQGSSIRHPC